MYLAYESLPPELKENLRGKRALHIHEYNRAKQANPAAIGSTPHSYHPVFITHPDTGQKSLFVDRLMTTAIEGMSETESAAVLEQLYAAGERREFIYEHVWRPGDFVMWDNLCTIHARTDFPKEERRLLRRCTVEGQPCVSDASGTDPIITQHAAKKAANLHREAQGSGIWDRASQNSQLRRWPL